MKFCILTQYYPPEIGAPQARLSELAKRFVKRGHEVVILTAMPNYPRGQLYPGYKGLFQRERWNGTQILRSYIYPTKRVSLVPRLTNYFSFVASSFVVGTLALPKVDFLLTESPPLFLGISGYLLSRLKRTRWIFNVSDLWPASAVHLGVIGEGVPLRMAERLEAFCYRKAWGVTGQSREILANIQQRFPDVSTYHLSNGVDTTLFHPELRSDVTRRELADDKSKSCVAIYAGLHGIAQGLEQVLEAAAKVQELQDFKIVFVGDGPEKENLQRYSHDLGLTNVKFLAPRPREAMPQLVASADIALVPLLKRLPGAVPSKLYEAMGARLPVILIAEGEAADIVRDTESGIVVPPGNIDMLASVLRELVENREKRTQLGLRGRQAATSRFDRQAIADGFIDFLEGHL